MKTLKTKLLRVSEEAHLKLSKRAGKQKRSMRAELDVMLGV